MEQLNQNKEFQKSLNGMKDKVINLIIGIFAIINIPALLISLSRIAYIGVKPVMILHIVLCPILLVLYILRNKLKTITKIVIVNAILIAIPLAGYLTFGFVNSVSYSFALCVTMMTVLLGKKAGYINFSIMCFIVFMSFLGFKSGFFKYDVSTNMLLTNTAFWLNQSIPMFMISFTIISSLGMIYEYLVKVITETKVQNEELLHSRNNYKKLLEFFPDAVILKHKRNIIYANKAAVKLFKAKNEQEIKEKSSYDLTHSDYYDVLEDILEKQSNGENLESFIDYKIVTFDEEVIDVELCHIILEPKEDQMFLTVLHDISERKRIEKTMKLLNEAQESENLRTEFFANLSHELRTPVSVISSALQVMEKVTDEKSTRKYTAMIKQNCYRLIRLINNLIDSTKIDVGFLKLNVSCNNIVSVVEDISMSVNGFIESNGMTMVFETEIEEKFLDFDSDAIERIILNLISNSVKFRHVNGTIFIRIFDKGDRVMISVKDDGIGIPREQQEFIFDRFKKVDRSFTRNAEGSGIGLSIVKSLVELHKGTIELISEEGIGSEFVIELPVTGNRKECCIHCVREPSKDIAQKVNIEFSDIYTVA
ncbi:MAG: domain S-box protein [Bacillales bacterium]|jgi:PAS domain S-box-containing protein|nr:domain S-box protein [Bacillales bacterium]